MKSLDATKSKSTVPASRLTDRAYLTLEEMIITLQLPPASSWSEAGLVDKVKIGRTPVREAIQRLAVDRLVSVLPRHGITVSDIDFNEQIMIVELRRELDRLISRRATRLARQDERQQLKAYSEQLMKAARDEAVLEYLRIHMAVRRLVSSCARNPYAARALEPLDSLSRRFMYAHQSGSVETLHGAELHCEVLNAIIEGDEDRAAEASDRRMDRLEEFCLKTMGIRPRR